MIEFENAEQWNLQQMAQTFNKKGFVLGGKLLSDASIDLLNEKIEKYLAIQRTKNAEDVSIMGNDKSSVILQMCNVWYGVDEIAEILHIPIGTVKTRIFVARRQLREALNVYGQYYGLENAIKE